jgi:metal-responsive CopG/Arc/MetJ family transcriptional regulator
MRTLVDIPEQDLNALDALRTRRGVSRAELIRAAIGDYLARNPRVEGNAAFGLWQERPADGVEYQRRVRDEW